MSLTQELRARYDGLWEGMVTHPFVIEMGDGTLPEAKFREYFLQDYVFVNDLVSVVALGMSKAPSLKAAGVLNDFLTGILNLENDLFVRAFRELGASEEEYSSAGASPTTQAFGDFLVRTALEGDFEDIATLLYVTEGTYLDWGTRLIEAGKKLGRLVDVTFAYFIGRYSGALDVFKHCALVCAVGYDWARHPFDSLLAYQLESVGLHCESVLTVCGRAGIDLGHEFRAISYCYF